MHASALGRERRLPLVAHARQLCLHRAKCFGHARAQKDETARLGQLNGAALTVTGGEAAAGTAVAGLRGWMEEARRSAGGAHGVILSMDANSPPQYDAADTCWKVRTCALSRPRLRACACPRVRVRTRRRVPLVRRAAPCAVAREDGRAQRVGCALRRGRCGPALPHTHRVPRGMLQLRATSSHPASALLLK